MEQESGTIPLLTNTKPILASFAATRMSIANVIVIPTPTAAPFIAAMMGFLHLYAAKATFPPESRDVVSESFW